MRLQARGREDAVMRLYHYTGAEHAARIAEQGLTWLQLPYALPGRIGIERRVGSWLTTEGDWQAQSWATSHLTCCDRTEVRFVVRPSGNIRDAIVPWRVAYGMLGLDQPETIAMLTDGHRGADAWWISLVRIPRGNLRLEKRHAELLSRLPVAESQGATK